MVPQKATLQCSCSCKNNRSVSLPPRSPGFRRFCKLGMRNQTQTHPLTKVLKLMSKWLSPLPLQAFKLLNKSVGPWGKKKRKAIKSTLNFSTELHVKLWDNCHDLINKRNGSSSWPGTGEWENNAHLVPKAMWPLQMSAVGNQTSFSQHLNLFHSPTWEKPRFMHWKCFCFNY